MKMKVCEAVADALIVEASGQIFGLMGDANMAVWGALSQDQRVRMVCSRHESGAIAMADGYAQASGRLGLATVTCGPGLANSATALLSAARAGSPIVVFTGQYTEDGGRNNLQAFDTRLFARACETEFRELGKLETLAEDIAEGFYTARSRSCPVIISLPYDLWEADLPWEWQYRPSTDYLVARDFAPAPQQLEQVLQRLAQAERPVIVAGRGARYSGARKELEQLGDRIGALLATSMVGKGFFDGHPYDVGISGSFGSAVTEELLAQADLVLSFGASLNFFTVEGGMMFPSADVIRVDTKPYPPNIGFTPGLYVSGDARATAAALSASLDRAGIGGRSGFRTQETRDILNRAPVMQPRPTDGLDPRELMRVLSLALPDKTQVVSGAGHFWGWVVPYLALPPGASFQHTCAFGSIGLALPAGIGAALASPDRRTLVIEGDGSLLQAIQELHAAADQKIPVTVLLMNDSGYGAEVLKMQFKGRSPRDAAWTSPDYVALSRAFGGDGVRLEREEDLTAAIAQAADFDGPFVIDARISPTIVSDIYSRMHLGQPNETPLLRPARR